jgi:hypothetical protein
MLETAKAREVAGLFRSREKLQAAVDDLLLYGFDRADLDLMGSPDRVHNVLRNASISLDLAGAPRVSKGVPAWREDIALVQAMIVAIFGFVAAAAAAAVVIALGGSIVPAIIAAALAGSIAAALSGLVFARHFKPKDVVVLDENLQGGGVIVWVRVRTADQEAKARQILLAHGAGAVREVETEIAKTPEDIPLSRLRPDPFIPVRLGQP